MVQTFWWTSCYNGVGGTGDPQISQLPVPLATAGVFRVLVFRHFWNRDNWEISGPANPCGLLANRRKTPLSRSVLSLKMWAFWFAYICLKQKSILRAVRGVSVHNSSHCTGKRENNTGAMQRWLFSVAHTGGILSVSGNNGHQTGLLEPFCAGCHFRWLWKKWMRNANF